VQSSARSPFPLVDGTGLWALEALSDDSTVFPCADSRERLIKRIHPVVPLAAFSYAWFMAMMLWAATVGPQPDLRSLATFPLWLLLSEGLLAAVLVPVRLFARRAWDRNVLSKEAEE
jgi:hypothetical protein